MQQAWNRYSFIRFVLFMALGIISGVFATHYYNFVFPLFCFASGAFLLAQAIRNLNFSSSHRFFFSVLAFIVCFSFGYLNSYWQAEKYSSDHVSQIEANEIQAFKAQLISSAKETDKTYGFTSVIKQVKTKGNWQTTSGKSMLYFQKDSSTAVLRFGDEILVQGSLSELRPPKNPGEFDYKRFLSFQQVYFQQYVPESKVWLLQRDKGNMLLAASLKVSHYLESQLDKYIQNPRSLAISKALTLGIKDELDNDLRNAYAAAGAMHVLAVSGLHVGIIFLIVATLFKKWRYHQKGRFAFALVSLTVLWFYAFITGLSPSVLRAATMFSFIIIAQASRRRTNIYNTLAASAFVLLCYNPYLLFSVGFQLSYLAVLGIVFFQPKIYRLLQFRYWLPDKIWAITCVAITAQLATAPLGLLYFHQFPTYFFLSNLVVIPAAFIILNGTLLLLLSSLIPVIASSLGYVLDLFIQFVNYLVFGLELLPKSTIDGVFINTLESWVIYSIIFCFGLLIVERKIVYLKLVCFAAIIFSASVIARQVQSASEKSLILYDVGKSNALSLRVGFNHFLTVSDELGSDKNKLRFHVYPAQLRSGVADFHPDNLHPDHKNNAFKEWQGGDITVWQDHTIVVWDKEIFDTIYMMEKMSVDLLIIGNNAIKEVSQIYQFFLPKKIILDASNSYFTIQKLKANFKDEKIDFYVVSEDGAFELKL